MADKPTDGITLTRRQAVAALGAGVVVAGGAVALTAAEAANRANRDAEQQSQDLQAQLAEASRQQEAMEKQLAAASKEQDEMEGQLAAAYQQKSEMESELAAARLQIEMYRGLAGLYDTLDRIGIDSIVGTAMGAYRGTLDALQGGVTVLREGIVRAENALDSFENGFATVRTALTTAENAWANVNALLNNAQELIKNATSPLLPFVDQARRFFDDLLGKIPFGAGEGARQGINGVIGLMVAIPNALDSLEDGLFRTLREGWFNEDNARNLEATLAKPIIEGVLQPARGFLDKVDTTLNSWETQVAQPVNAALSQRQIVQKQIAEYKQENGMG